MDKLNVFTSDIYTFVDNTDTKNVDEKRKLLKNRYYADSHHFYLANYDDKEAIIVVHKENEDAIDEKNILKLLSEKENRVITKMTIKKFW